ncbi:ATP-binding cassette domain-containing protein [Streptomyces sp. ME02-8801-2C]|uniref:ABC transporter ATP-binding protein n=1 Tax=Streptomyces sp. ME02-8801-2C TaxID=3028680 RepID=UPI0029B7D689|nr:ATP-binding cassette domain-containing protein [Streptomyces sp. ME02-8801-2C]MDX3458207.1 ATP-binding cassette domain-containing protein [Streptomyces sp. ME02-8801-2C]
MVLLTDSRPGSGREHEAGITARNLRKVFRTAIRRPGFAGAVRSLVNPERTVKAAVSDVTFSVGPGELLALLGPNGAGKSTTIKMLTGILVPTSGVARVAGLVPHRDRRRNARTIGAVFGQRTQLWWDLPARESLRILRDIYGVPEAEHRARIREFDEILELRSFWDTRVRHLSLGQRVRCDLAAAFLHGPQVVFLDEPTIGMDVIAKEQVREFLRREVDKRGRTVLLTTHDMTEVARLAERVVLINHGRTVLDGHLDEIRRRFGGWQIHATLGDLGADPAAEQPTPPPGVRILHRQGSQVVFGPDDTNPTMQEALRRVIGCYEVVDLKLEQNDLEDVMRAAYLREDERTHGDGGSATESVVRGA